MAHESESRYRNKILCQMRTSALGFALCFELQSLSLDKITMSLPAPESCPPWIQILILASLFLMGFFVGSFDCSVFNILICPLSLHSLWQTSPIINTPPTPRRRGTPLAKKTVADHQAEHVRCCLNGRDIWALLLTSWWLSSAPSSSDSSRSPSISTWTHEISTLAASANHGHKTWIFGHLTSSWFYHLWVWLSLPLHAPTFSSIAKAPPSPR